MNKTKHIELLKKSITEWNSWRQQNPRMLIDLRWADLHDANLCGSTFGFRVDKNDIGGDDAEWIVALTDEEWRKVQAEREGGDG